MMTHSSNKQPRTLKWNELKINFKVFVTLHMFTFLKKSKQSSVGGNVVKTERFISACSRIKIELVRWQSILFCTFTPIHTEIYFIVWLI